MANASDFENFPPDEPTAELAFISLSKLVAGDADESQRFFDCCTQRGIFMLELACDPGGQTLLNNAMGMYALAEEVFSLDEVEKTKYLLNWKNTNGYKPVGMTKVDGNGTPDRCEFWTFGRDDVNGLTDLGHQPPSIQNQVHLLKAFMASSSDIITHLLSHLESHLDLVADSLTAMHTASKPSGSQTRLLRYDPQPDGDRRTSMVSHTDQGSMRVLFNTLGGLQVLRDPYLDTSAGKPQAESDWIYIRPMPGTAIVNCGDALRKWTNNLVKSPKHRVTYAPGPQMNLTRYSIAFFARPEHEALMCRLDGSNIVPELEEMVMEERITAKEWHYRMSVKHRSAETEKATTSPKTVSLQSHLA